MAETPIEGTEEAEGRQSILVIEDDPVQARLYLEILRRGGYDVRCATGAQPLANALETTEPPALLLSDINLPDLDGLTFIQNLLEHRNWCMVPVILMTAEPTRDRIGVSQSVSVPPEALLVKPVHPAPLLRLVRDILRREQAIYLLRHLQRSRLATRLRVETELKTMERSMAGAAGAIQEANDRIGSIRRDLQTARRHMSLLGRESPEAQRAAQETLDRLERDLGDYKNQIESYEADRRQVVARRHETLLNFQRELKNLEDRIHALGEVARLQQHRKEAA